MSARLLDQIDGILARGDDADDVLRAVVAELAGEPSIVWAGISFLDEGELLPGPSAGVPDEDRRTTVPVCFQGTKVGELSVDGETDEALAGRVAAAISAHVLLGWDTGGEAWVP